MLHSLKSIALISFFLLAQPAVAATAANTDVIGKFGFDWLKPEKAKCAAISDKSLGASASCTYNKEGDTGSFSGKADYYTCKVGKSGELMIYKTQARCNEELEIMKSNGP